MDRLKMHELISLLSKIEEMSDSGLFTFDDEPFEAFQGVKNGYLIFIDVNGDSYEMEANDVADYNVARNGDTMEITIQMSYGMTHRIEVYC